MSTPLSHRPHPSSYRGDLRPIDEPLHVVTMVSNPLRWRSRHWNYWAFERHMAASGAVLHTVEVALGERPFELTTPDHPRHLQLRTRDELWHKENALNLATQRLPPEAKYVAWIDADVQFMRPDWVQETIQGLQHHCVLQLFSQAQDLAPDYAVTVPPAHGFAYCYVEGLPSVDAPGPLRAGAYAGEHADGVYWHPGFAWAARRAALDDLGGLLDFGIVGSADWHMATALVGQVEKSLGPPYTPTYKAWTRAWAQRAERHIRRDIGYLPGLLVHHYHGAKSHRGYHTRWQIIRTFDPLHDLRRTTQGLWALSPDNIALRDALRRYNRARREDS